MDVAPVEVRLPEEEILTDLADVDNLSEYKEAVISYITAFIVKKMKQKVTCMPCSLALTSDSAHPFLELKNRGGLQKPSAGIIAVCQATEKCFQRLLKTNGGKAPQGRGTTMQIVSQVLADCLGKNLFPNLYNHVFDMCVEANHVYVLTRMVSAWYYKGEEEGRPKKSKKIIISNFSESKLITIHIDIKRHPVAEDIINIVKC